MRGVSFMTGFKLLYEKDLRIAKSNYTILQQTLDDAFLSSTCFYIQQALEKFLKFKLEMVGVSHVSGHNLRRLCELLDSRNVTYDKRILPYLREVSEWAVESRYNANFIADRTTVSEVLSIIEDMIKSDSSLTTEAVRTNLFIK